jgi:hypothetical protein
MVGQLPLGLCLTSLWPAICRGELSGPWTLVASRGWEWCRSSRASLHVRADSRSSACRRSVYFCAAYMLII